MSVSSWILLIILILLVLWDLAGTGLFGKKIKESTKINDIYDEHNELNDEDE